MGTQVKGGEDGSWSGVLDGGTFSEEVRGMGDWSWNDGEGEKVI